MPSSGRVVRITRKDPRKVHSTWPRGFNLRMASTNSGGSTWIEVRIMDFSAPELDDPGGADARGTLRRLVLNREAQCVVTPGRTGTHSYDRTHAICRAGGGGRTIGDLMREAEAPEGGR